MISAIQPLIPKIAGGPLRVLILGRISTIHQNVENIDASYRYVETYLKQAYQGDLHIKHLGEQASGMRTDRATIMEADDEIATGTWDLVITEDLSRIYRNPRHQYIFVQDAYDADTRVICIGDNLDSADENWEVMMGAASIRHGLQIPDTRRRVRRTATHAFHRGGMVQKVKYGYRKLTQEEAETGQFGPKGLRLTKIAECTPIIQEMKQRILDGAMLVSVADWLNGEGIKPGTYVRHGTWTARLVDGLLRDPLLCGQRSFRKVLHEPIFRTGKHRRKKNSDPEVEQYPELAHMTQDEQEDVIRTLEARRPKCSARRTGRNHPRFNQPRSRVFWPAQHPKCAVCGGLMYRYDADSLKCQNAHRGGDGACWNHVQVSCQATREKLLAMLLDLCKQSPEAWKAPVDTAWAAFESYRQRNGRSRAQIDQEITELERRSANLAEAISQGGELTSLVDKLRCVEQSLKAARLKRDQDSSRPALPEQLSRDEVEAQLEVILREVASSSYEFADLMRRIIPDFRIVPVQPLDSGLVRPRALLTLNLAALAKPVADDQVPSVTAMIDLFDPPLHIHHMAKCRDEKVKDPGLSLKQIASRVGLNYMTVKRALDYAQRMEREGTTTPYRELKERPASASRWLPRRNAGCGPAGNRELS